MKFLCDSFSVKGNANYLHIGNKIVINYQKFKKIAHDVSSYLFICIMYIIVVSSLTAAKYMILRILFDLSACLPVVNAFRSLYLAFLRII